MMFAVLGDPHRGVKDVDSYLDDACDDIMNDNDLGRCSFVIDVGDSYHNHYIMIHTYPNSSQGSWKTMEINRTHTPLFWATGNHDNRWDESKGHSEVNEPTAWETPYDRQNLVEKAWNEIEMIDETYAMCQDNILFLFLGLQSGAELITHKQKDWLYFMTETYADKTVVIVTHNIADSGITQFSSKKYRHLSDQNWWEKYFDEHTNIKLYIHGHNHYYDSAVTNRSKNMTWGHNIAFVLCPSFRNAFDGGHKPIIFNISSKYISWSAWDSNTSVWSNRTEDYNWTFVTTSYNPNARDWICFPVWLQDEQTIKYPNKYICKNATLQLVGIANEELFINSFLNWTTSQGNDTWYGFEGARNFSQQTNTMRIPFGNVTISFPGNGNNDTGDAYGWYIKEIGYAIPGERYNISLRVKGDANNNNALDLDVVTVSDDGNVSTYLRGSETTVLTDEDITTSYQWFNGSYIVPDNNDAWYIQGNISFSSGTAYNLDTMSVKRYGNDTTHNFHLKLCDKWWNHTGSLNAHSYYNYTLNATDYSDIDGNISFYCNISGSQVGIAQVYFDAPLLLTRNFRVRINWQKGNKYNITKVEQLSAVRDFLEVYPFNLEEPWYGNLSITPGLKLTTGNGNNYLFATSGTEDSTIQYGPVNDSNKNLGGDMAKNCVDCHKKIGFLAGYHVNEDGSYTCDICFDKQKQIKEIDEEVDQL